MPRLLFYVVVFPRNRWEARLIFHHNNTKPMNIIQLSGKRYEVRRTGDIREVKYNGKWILAADFADILIANQDYQAVMELTAYGHNQLVKNKSIKT